MSRDQDLTPGDYHAFLRSRRSVRRFLPSPVPGKILEHVLETATWAPSAHNRQPWRFAVVASRESRNYLADRMGADFLRDLLADGLEEVKAREMVERSRARIREAPVCIILCLDPTLGDSYPDAFRQQAELTMGVQSVALAGGTLLLAAHAEGLGGVWVCAPLFAPQTVRSALDLPPNWEPQGMILLGFPDKIPDPRPRRPVAEVARFL